MNDTPSSSRKQVQPNFLVLLVDEERYPPVYENKEISEWRRQHLLTQQLLKPHALAFNRHYIGSSACSPSRATLFTGHYPSLHGVSQTDGVAKGAFDSDMYWLDRNTVPTMGDYFREAGYQTYYKGKWHISDEDILVPGTHASVPSYHPWTGVPDRQLEQLYAGADRLDRFGFTSWIGPEPHGKNPRNSGSSAAIGVSGRDEVYGTEVAELLAALDRQQQQDPDAKPWFVVASFVNPHDIVLYGALTARLPTFRFEVDPNVPFVAPAPTSMESLDTKPRCQASYRDIYPRALQPILDHPFYRRLYYQLQHNADRQMVKVLAALTRMSCYDHTIVIFTSDHGDLLGAHGNLHQKWYTAYEEVLHVPLLIHNKHLFPQPLALDTLTSHVDLLPTLLGLANVNTEEVRIRLQPRFSEARPLVGRDLTPLISDPHAAAAAADAPVYFMTDDDVTRGQHQFNVLGEAYPAVEQPNHIETVLMTLEQDGTKVLWKFSRYFDNVQFWSQPGVQDVTRQPVEGATDGPYTHTVKRVKTQPLQDEYELYNLSDDPLEMHNLAHAALATPYSLRVQQWMMEQLDTQRRLKRLSPSSPSIPR